jgi:hypothetical protein
MMNMEMMAGTGTVLIMGIEMRVGGRWSILFSTIKISMRTRHEKSRIEREKKREEDEDVSGVSRKGRGPCVVGGDAYVPHIIECDQPLSFDFRDWRLLCTSHLGNI